MQVCTQSTELSLSLKIMVFNCQTKAKLSCPVQEKCSSGHYLVLSGQRTVLFPIVSYPDGCIDALILNSDFLSCLQGP